MLLSRISTNSIDLNIQGTIRHNSHVNTSTRTTHLSRHLKASWCPRVKEPCLKTETEIQSWPPIYAQKKLRCESFCLVLPGTTQGMVLVGLQVEVAVVVARRNGWILAKIQSIKATGYFHPHCLLFCWKNFKSSVWQCDSYDDGSVESLVTPWCQYDPLLCRHCKRVSFVHFKKWIVEQSDRR